MSKDDLPAIPALAVPQVFPFPYPTPYDIQVDLMRTVFRAIEERKIAIVESPTGTGKSLTLLTSTLSWLQAHRRRLDQAAEDDLRRRLAADDPDDPPWVVEHTLKSRLAELRAGQDAHRARLAEAREKERQRRKRMDVKVGAFRNGAKRVKVDYEDDKVFGIAGNDEEFLPEDSTGGCGDEQTEDGFQLSKEVRALIARYEASKPRNHAAEEEEEDIPKIYYTSRTHTQLRQLTAELLKTSFPAKAGTDPSSSPEDDEHGVSLVPLASRRQLCINPKVQSLARKAGDDRMNEACLDMQKSGVASGRCEFLPRKEEEGPMLDMRDAILANVRDIEDIVSLGKDSGVCPYYATRRAVKQSQLVTLPYNLLLQKNAREALNIDLTDQVVVIDEAHNLIDTLLTIYSTTLTSTHVSQAVSQLTQFLARFRTRLKPVHSLWIRQALSVLEGLKRLCDTYLVDGKAKSAGGLMLDTAQLMGRMGGSNDQINLLEMVKYLKESKLARKISGFAEKTADDAAKKGAVNGKNSISSATKHASIAAFHQVEAFLLSLTDARDDGRIILSVDMPPAFGSGIHDPVVTLRYMLLNPAERFKEVLDSARCVVLAGGTMEPISDFMLQLFPTIPRDRISTLSCSHVIPKNNLLTQVVSVGPKKVDFEFKFANRGDEKLLSELGAVIASAIGLVPDGVVVFLPSYAFLDKVKSFWKASGVLERLAQKKQIFYEPQTSSEVEATLRDYALAIETSQTAAGPGRSKGALLFAVVGGKLSEGINFSDGLGRCVIMVGLPFANVGSVELKERMKYVESLPGAGKDAARELYENLCMRAVNQSIGRAIRHANDYATILLVDRRYATQRIRSKLPKWIGADVQAPPDYAGVARRVAAFFREKRERGK